MSELRLSDFVRVSIALLAMLSTACGGRALTRAHPTTALPMPEQAARRAALADLGERTWAAMASGELASLLYGDADLEILVSGSALTRVGARRLSLENRLQLDSSRLITPLANASYAGICLQGARSEEAGGPMGLTATAWVFERLLIIGRRASGQRIAAWVEGTFVFTDVGFGALDLERVEIPRWEHSDLEIAPCDLAIRNDLPEIAQ